ncbi:hypothetical protein F2982_04020 [Rhizobium sp. BG4]|nr:hypothetical protein F2982_04020 [Rhizobium sp. BG4]
MVSANNGDVERAEGQGVVQHSPPDSLPLRHIPNPPSFLCLSQESTRRASARRETPASTSTAKTLLTIPPRQNQC